jgi:mannose-6-phosphate isomerase-like protein (cupin superfamily)
MGPATARSIDTPDETVSVDRGRFDVVGIGSMTLGRAELEPGWRWSQSVRSIAGTDSCQLHHHAFVVSGALHIAMNDGSELEVRAGDAFVAPPGHDAWVVGDETCVVLDFASSVATYGPLAPHAAHEAPQESRSFAHATANLPLMQSKK